jgi:thiamine biosynthesis protein ThiS
MKIKLNNRIEIIDQPELTLDEVIKSKNFTYKMLVTKVNGKVVKKDERSDFKIFDGDDVLILHLVSGG